MAPQLVADAGVAGGDSLDLAPGQPVARGRLRRVRDEDGEIGVSRRRGAGERGCRQPGGKAQQRDADDRAETAA